MSRMWTGWKCLQCRCEAATGRLRSLRTATGGCEGSTRGTRVEEGCSSVTNACCGHSCILPARPSRGCRARGPGFRAPPRAGHADCLRHPQNVVSQRRPYKSRSAILRDGPRCLQKAIHGHDNSNIKILGNLVREPFPHDHSTEAVSLFAVSATEHLNICRAGHLPSMLNFSPFAMQSKSMPLPPISHQ